MSSLYITVPIALTIYIMWGIDAYARARHEFRDPNRDYHPFERILQAILLFVILAFNVICIYALVDNPQGGICDL